MKAYEHQPSAYPDAQLQWYASGTTARSSLVDSVHVAPFQHGWLAHSSISIVQFSPVNPGAHVQVKNDDAIRDDVLDSSHVAPFKHG